MELRYIPPFLNLIFFISKNSGMRLNWIGIRSFFNGTWYKNFIGGKNKY